MYRSIKIMVICISILIGYSYYVHAAEEQHQKGHILPNIEDYNHIHAISKTFSAILKKYVDIDKVEIKHIAYKTIKAMIDALDDPYCQFLSAELMNKLQDIENKATPGIVIDIKQNNLTVVTTIKGSPADNSGIRTGDEIIQINNIIPINMFEAVTMLRGKPDTYVNITIYRPATNEFLGFDIPRIILDNPTVEYKVMDNNIGYIQIIQFTNNTAEEFEYAISELKQLNVQKLILDLRNNPGDDMESTMKIADILFPAERTIYFVRSKSSLIDKEFVTLNDTWWAVPLVILINEGSASSAEILAGAVQDHTRGVIIGAKSFGKGLKQSIITLPNSAGISLTTYKYYTPTGRPIHTGIIPDIIITEHDKQLQKAIEVVNNLTLPVASTYDTL